MAEWWAEGFLRRLIDRDDPVARMLLRGAEIFVVPNMNPDGSWRGHLRVNASGANLNRCWANPTMQASPEVLPSQIVVDVAHVCVQHDSQASKLL